MTSVNTMTKTVWQYSKPLPKETMDFLNGVALDCCKVKNYTYKRYSGVKNLGRLTPVYSILNEMRYCGLREELNLPTVYYELAISDAITDIKGNWGILKNKIGNLITVNENLSTDDKKYLRTVLKINSTYAAILNHQEYEMPKNAQDLSIDVKHLNNILCRLTRKYQTVPKTGNTNSFKISPNGYSYKDGAIRIVCRTPRKRISIPLKDDRTFDRQLQIQIKENSVVIAIPIETKIKEHQDYTNTIYVYIGNKDMFTLSNGNVYGKSLDILVNPETERLSKKNQERGRFYTDYRLNVEAGNFKKASNIEFNNLGKIKYEQQKEKERNKTTTFINSEINRMLREEKPNKIIITKPIMYNKTKYRSKQTNRKLSRSFVGYIRKRLLYKCQIQSIELIEINANKTGNICSQCGAKGIRQGTEFLCESCGLRTSVPLNSAKNIQMKYITYHS